MYQTISAILIAIVTVGLSAYDLLPALNETPGDTISAVIRSWAKEWAVVPYIWGVLGGHFFLGYPQAITDPTGDLYITMFSIWSMFLASLVMRSYGTEVSVWIRLLVMAVGVLMGSFFWSQA
jgi:hypothetical protein